MKKLNKQTGNQSIGIGPMLLFIYLDNYLFYKHSFYLCIGLSLLIIFSIRRFINNKGNCFMLIPTLITFILFAFVMALRIPDNVYSNSPIIIEILFVVSLALMGLYKPILRKKVHNLKIPRREKRIKRFALNEFYYMLPIVQNIYTLHLFALLIHKIMPPHFHSEQTAFFLQRVLPIVLGLIIIAYESVRLYITNNQLSKETWLPIVDKKGKEIGLIARSVSRLFPAKYCHPVIRIAYIYKGMLLLAQRSNKKSLFPGQIDLPIYKYILYQETLEESIKRTIPDSQNNGSTRFLIKYNYEDKQIKQLVSLHILCIKDEKELKKYESENIKLWTSKQIDENIGKGIFTKLFETEYPYLKSTILYADNYCFYKKTDNKKEAIA